MKTVTILTSALLCVFTPAFAQKSNAPPPTSTTSTVEITRKEGRDVVITTNRRFKHVHRYTEGKPPSENYQSVLLLEEFRSEWSPAVEGEAGALNVDAWLGKGFKPDKKAWAIKSDANIGEASETFYKTTNYGCCASVNVLTWYNILTGQKVFTGTNNLVKITVPNTGGDQLDRYVTFHAIQGAIGTPEMRRLQDVMGVLQYGTAKRALHRILVRTSEQETLNLGEPEMGVSHREETKYARYDQDEEVTIWKYDGKTDTSSLSDFTIILKWEDTMQIVIPVKNDVPQLNEAKVPAKIKLEFPKP